ncbi:hypothetical protein X777_16092 [Ooceraea biroi]|uniref:Uncharacterized protein n=1 Tax=Ooceraea biroi TaxID=2015173 RepID=A0A026WXL7_OOCBI|nr:hypothetical protein X777_16092 [Ooceraea biroi]
MRGRTFSCGLKHKTIELWRSSARVERTPSSNLHRGTSDLSRTRAPEYEGVGLMPPGSKLVTDCQRASQSASQLTSQPATQTTSQPANQPTNQPICLPTNQLSRARHRDAMTAKGRRGTCVVVPRSADLPASANSVNFARHSVCGRKAELAARSYGEDREERAIRIAGSELRVTSNQVSPQ